MTVFHDTNVLLYRVTQGDVRQLVARRLLSAGGFISVQVLNEFVDVASRKMKMSWSELSAALSALRTLVAVEPLTLAIHDRALALAARHGFRIYDASIIASALEAGCTTLYSEDMQNGMLVDQTLTIINPFLTPSP